MTLVSDILSTGPEKPATPLQQSVYAALSNLGIDFSRVDCSPAVTINDCLEIEIATGAPVIKTLFLTNRQQTKFYLLSMPGHKPFITKTFSAALSIPRVSFADASMMMTMLNTPVGAASPLVIIADNNLDIRMIVDSELLANKTLACPDGTTTSYLAIATSDIFNRYIPSTGHTAEFITL